MLKRHGLLVNILSVPVLLALGLSGCGGPSQATSKGAATAPPATPEPLLVLTDSILHGASTATYQVTAIQHGKTRWAVALPAPGDALAEAGGVVYVGASETVYALDTQTGHQRWQAPTSQQVRKIQIIEGQVYVDTGGGFTGQERLVVFSPDGQVRWRYTPPDGQDIPAWLVDAGSFYTAVSGFPASLVARDAATGTLRWQAPLHVDSPLEEVLPAGPAAVLVVTQDSLVVARRSEGAQVWQRTGTQAVGAAVQDGTLYAFFVDQPPTFGATAPVFLRALRVQDGRLLWQQRLASADEGFLSSGQPLRVGAITAQAAYLVDSPSFTTLHAWHLAEGQPWWTTSVGGRVDGLLADSAQVYLSSDQQLVALQVEGGQARWQQANSDGLTFLQEAAGVLVGVNRLTSTLAGFDPTTGQRLWRLQPQPLDQYLLV